MKKNTITFKEEKTDPEAQRIERENASETWK